MSESARPRSPWFARTALVAVLLAFYLPLLFMIRGAFRAENGEWTLHWFFQVFADDGLISGFLNSLLVGVISSAGATVLGTGAAVALSRGPFGGRRLLQSLSSVALILPEIVFALALLSWFFLLQFQLSLFTVILAHISFSVSYVILCVAARLSQLPPSLEDAARDLGAGEFAYLLKILLPLLRPSIGAAFLLSFLLSFDDFLITFFVNGIGRDTLPIKLYTSMKMGLTPQLNALATLMWAGTSLLLIFLFRSRFFRDLLKAKETSDAR